ncbi:MAG: hypothetical protein JXB49_02665, partial [Bacteroidales bacterium]|nr:hypothetical protein [Bacteroidales bacterium]
MKKYLLNLLMIVALIGVTVQGNAQSSGEFVRSTSIISYTLSNVSVDGSLNDEAWLNAEPNKIERNFGEETFDSDDDFSGFWKAVWNEDGLYIAVSMIDDINYTEGSYGQSWEKDIIELYFDMNSNNLEDGLGGSAGGQGHFQIAQKVIPGQYKWKASSNFAVTLDET